MTCSECPHCRANATRSGLRLPGPPQNFGIAGIDMAFYLKFATAYRLARATFPQPTKAMQDANPWMTTSQCRSYLKRSRGLGLELRPPLAKPEAGVKATGRRRGAITAPEQEPTGPVLSATAQVWQANGARVSVRMVKGGGHDTRTLTEDEARAVLGSWVDAGLADWDGPNAVQFPDPEEAPPTKARPPIGSIA